MSLYLQVNAVWYPLNTQAIRFVEAVTKNLHHNIHTKQQNSFEGQQIQSWKTDLWPRIASQLSNADWKFYQCLSWRCLSLKSKANASKSSSFLILWRWIGQIFVGCDRKMVLNFMTGITWSPIRHGGRYLNEAERREENISYIRNNRFDLQI